MLTNTREMAQLLSKLSSQHLYRSSFSLLQFRPVLENQSRNLLLNSTGPVPHWQRHAHIFFLKKEVCVPVLWCDLWQCSLSLGKYVAYPAIKVMGEGICDYSEIRITLFILLLLFLLFLVAVKMASVCLHNALGNVRENSSVRGLNNNVHIPCPCCSPDVHDLAVSTLFSCLWWLPVTLDKDFSSGIYKEFMRFNKMSSIKNGPKPLANSLPRMIHSVLGMQREIHSLRY